MSYVSPAVESPGISPLSQSSQTPYSPPPVHRPVQVPPAHHTLTKQPSFQAYPPPPPVLHHDPKRQSYVQSSSQLDFSMTGLSLASNNNGYTPAPPQQQQPSPNTEKSLPALPPMAQDAGRSASTNGQGVAQLIHPRIEFTATAALSDELGSYLSDQDTSVSPPTSLSPAAQEAQKSSPPSTVTTITTTYSYPYSSPTAPSPLQQHQQQQQQQQQANASRSISPPPPTTASWSSFSGPAPVLTVASPSFVQQPPLAQEQQQPQHTAHHTEGSAPTQDQAPYVQNNYDPQSTFVPQSAYVPQSSYAPQSRPVSQMPQFQQQPPQLQQQQQFQQQHPYQQQQQEQQNSQASYILPPMVFATDQESPSTMVPSLGIPSPIHPSYPGSYRAPSPSPSLPAHMAGDRMSMVSRSESSRSDSTTSAPRMSMSSEDSRGALGVGERRHLRAVSHGHGHSGLIPGRVSPLPLQINPNNNSDLLKPIPSNSEDWAALIDTPDSPIHERGNGGMRQFQGLGGYTDSPAEEPVQSSDYMQHVSQHQRGRSLGYGYPQAGQSLTDPSHQRQSYQHHQQHSSTSSVPLPTGNAGPADPAAGGGGGMYNMAVPGGNRQLHRQSWSPNTFEPLEAPASRGSLNGYLTPPRRRDGSPVRRTHSKQSSVATSVSLLSDQAIVAKYRDAANKTNDANLQLSYAKYLLEIGEPSSGPPSAEVPSSTGSASVGGAPPPSSGGTPQLSSPTPSQQPQQQQDDPESMGKKKLTEEAIYWIDRLAKEGQPEAQFIRGVWYEDGLYGTKKNADKALRLFQSASKGDFSAAHYKVGCYCERRKDNNKAVVLYKKAATQNDVPSNHRLAMVYLYGELGQSRNMKTGLQYLKRAATFATESAPMAPYVLAQILAREYKQLSIPDDIAFPDDGEALEWFKKAADLGYGPANFKLGTCYEYGTLGCSIDPFLSIHHYEHAVQAGDATGEAEMALSGWYLSGAENCFEADDALAFQYAAKAAEKQLPKAQYAMGYYYEVGISIPADLGRAMEFYKLAAANGNKEAQARLSENSTKFDKSGHKNSIRRISHGRNAKDSNCSIM